jgi:hypothetical protein
MTNTCNYLILHNLFLNAPFIGKAVMTDDQLADQLLELKRRNETPLPLIEMFEALLSLDPSLSAKQKRKKSTQIMARALERLERKDA